MALIAVKTTINKTIQKYIQKLYFVHAYSILKKKNLFVYNLTIGIKIIYLQNLLNTSYYSHGFLYLLS